MLNNMIYKVIGVFVVIFIVDAALFGGKKTLEDFTFRVQVKTLKQLKSVPVLVEYDKSDQQLTVKIDKLNKATQSTTIVDFSKKLMAIRDVQMNGCAVHEVPSAAQLDNTVKTLKSTLPTSVLPGKVCQISKYISDFNSLGPKLSKFCKPKGSGKSFYVSSCRDASAVENDTKFASCLSSGLLFSSNGQAQLACIHNLAPLGK